MVEGDTAWYIILGMPIAFLSIITGLLVRSALYKKYGVTCFDISPEKKQYRKKHNKKTVIIISIVIVISIVSTLVMAVIGHFWQHTYSFADNVGVIYETQEDAKREYYKTKNHIMGKQKIYNVIDESFNEKTNEYILEVERFDYTFNKTNKGYKHKGIAFHADNTFTFKTKAEKEKFILENTYEKYDFDFWMLEREVNFDDEKLAILYKNESPFKYVSDSLVSGFLLISGEIVLVCIISAIVYKRKTKNL
jgi:hypothetical protein